MIRSSDGSLTRSKVLDRNAGTGFPCKHSSGRGKLFTVSKSGLEEGNWEEDMVENASKEEKVKRLTAMLDQNERVVGNTTGPSGMSLGSYFVVGKHIEIEIVSWQLRL